MTTIFLFSFTTQASEFDVSRTDHQKHMAVSAAGVVLGTTILTDLGVDKTESILAAVFVTSLLGIVKETCIDETPERGDLIANGIGMAAGAVISIPL